MNILILTSNSLKSKIVYHYLNNKYTVTGVVIDHSNRVRDAKWERIKRRIKKLGLFTVFQQIIFCKWVLPMLVSESSKRVKEVIGSHGVSDPAKHYRAIEVDSINDEATIEHVKNIAPDLVIVHGTSILSSNTLSKLDCPAINFHIGITPKYRGLHGGYWALYNRDADNFGSTVHFVDSGIDTGEVLAQKRISVGKDDNFYSYQVLQTVNCLDCFDIAIEKIQKRHEGLEEKDKSVSREVTSKYYSHPTITQYLYGRLVLGVK